MIFPPAARLCLGPAPLLAVNIPTDWCWRGPAPSHTHNGVFTTTWELCPRQKVMNFQSHFSNISPGKTAINLGNCLSSGPLIIVNGDPQPSTQPSTARPTHTFLAFWRRSRAETASSPAAAAPRTLSVVCAEQGNWIGHRLVSSARQHSPISSSPLFYISGS